MSVTMRSHSLLTLFTVEAPITVHVRVYVSNLEKYNTMQFFFLCMNIEIKKTMMLFLELPSLTMTLSWIFGGKCWHGCITDEFLIGNGRLYYNENVIFYQENLFMFYNVQTTDCKRINSWVWCYCNAWLRIVTHTNFGESMSLQMNWLSLRNNRLNFKTSGKLPHHSRRIYEYTSVLIRKNRRNLNNSPTCWSWQH
jgi:hypothetical protein